MKKLFTSESVTPGHPDKLCDQISDNILDAYLKEDPYSRVACEVCAHKNGIVVMGEVRSKASVDLEKIVRDTIIKVGYENDDLLFEEQLMQLADEIIDNNLYKSNVCSFFVDDIGKPLDCKLDNNNWCGGTGQIIAFDYKSLLSPLLRGLVP